MGKGRLLMFVFIFSFLVFSCNGKESIDSGVAVLVLNPTGKNYQNYGVEVPFEKLGISQNIKVDTLVVKDSSGRECLSQVEDRNGDGYFGTGDILYFVAELPTGYSLFSVSESGETGRKIDKLLSSRQEGDMIIISGKNFEVIFSGKSGLPQKYIISGKEVYFTPEFKVYGVSPGKIKGINWDDYRGDIDISSTTFVKLEKGGLRCRVSFVKNGISGFFYVYPDGNIEGNIDGDKNKITSTLTLKNIPLSQFQEIVLSMNYGNLFTKPTSYTCGGRFFFGGLFSNTLNIGIGVAQPHQEELDRPYPWIRIPSEQLLNDAISKNLGSIWLNHLPGDRFWLLFFTSKDSLQEKLDMIGSKIDIFTGRELVEFSGMEEDYWTEVNNYFKKLSQFLNIPSDLKDYRELFQVMKLYKEMIKSAHGYIEMARKDVEKIKEKGYETAGIEISLKYAELLFNIADFDLSKGRLDRHHKRTLEGLKELVSASEKLKQRIPKQLFGKKEPWFHGTNIATACYARPLELDYGYCANIFEPMLMSDYYKPLDILEIEYLHTNYTWDRLEEEEGIYDFSELDEFIKTLAKHSKKLYFQIGDNISIGMAPGWAVKKYKGWAYKDFPGTWMEKYAFTWVSPELYGNVPEWMQQLQKLVRKVVERYKTYEGSVINAWGVWNEPGFTHYGKEELFNQDHFMDCFRNFVKKRYGSIDELNSYWGTNYKSFADVKREPFLRASSDSKKEISMSGEWKFKVDPQDKGVMEKWYSPEYSDKNWLTIKVPGYWEEQFKEYKDYDGYAWYRKEIIIPEEWKGKRIVLKFGSVDDDCIVYLNGEMAYENKGYNVPFEIDITDICKKSNKLIIAVRVSDTYQLGGIYKDVLLSLPGIFRPYYEYSARVTDWHDFLIKQLADFLNFWNADINKMSPLPVAEKTGQAIDKKIILNGTDEFSKSKVYYGMAAFDFYSPSREINLYADLNRSAHNNAKPIRIGEFGWYTEDYTGSLSIPAKDIAHMSWAGFMHGVKGFYHWLWTSYCGFSDHRTSPNDAFIEVSKLNALAKIIPQVFSASPERKIAIFFPSTSILLSDGDSMRLRFESLYYMLNDMNIPIDFIDWKQIMEGRLTNYRLLIIPSSPYIRRDILDRIKEYVKNGGIVFAYCDLSIWDEKGRESSEKPGFGLQEIFGCKIAEIDVEIPKEIKTIQGLELKGKDIIYPIYPILKGNVEVVLGTDNLPLITKKKYGKGIAYLCSIDLGKIYENSEFSMLKLFVDFIYGILENCGASPDIRLWLTGVEAMVVKNDEASYLIVNNRLSYASNVEILLQPSSVSTERIYDLISFESCELTKSGNFLSMKIRVPAGSVKIFFLKKL